MTQRWTPQSRYILRYKTASIIKGLVFGLIITLHFSKDLEPFVWHFVKRQSWSILEPKLLYAIFLEHGFHQHVEGSIK